MLPVAAEFQDVPCRDAHMFEQFPRRMVPALRSHAAFLLRNPGDRLLPVHMGLVPVQSASQIVAQNLLIHLESILQPPMILGRHSCRVNEGSRRGADQFPNFRHTGSQTANVALSRDLEWWFL